MYQVRNNELRCQIELVSTLFYQRKEEEAWCRFNQVMELLMSYITKLQDKERIVQLNQGLALVVSAMERRDTILIADRLMHTISPMLEKLEV